MKFSAAERARRSEIRSEKLMRDYADYLLLERSLSQRSIEMYINDAVNFVLFLQRSGAELKTCSSKQVRDYLSELSVTAQASSQARFLVSLRSLLRYLQLSKIRSDNPADKIDNPKIIHKLPLVLSEKTVEDFLNAPDLSTAEGLRDKAMLELLYATGLRVGELTTLRFSEVNLPEGYVLKKGKGGKERMVPFGKSAYYWLLRFIEDRRSRAAGRQVTGAGSFLFINEKNGKPVSRQLFWQRIHYYGKKLGLERLPSPHTFRHAFATHLLNHDADLRTVQLLLGHSSITTTQIYTHVATERMHRIYRKAHPRA